MSLHLKLPLCLSAALSLNAACQPLPKGPNFTDGKTTQSVSNVDKPVQVQGFGRVSGFQYISGSCGTPMPLRSICGGQRVTFSPAEYKDIMACTQRLQADESLHATVHDWAKITEGVLKDSKGSRSIEVDFCGTPSTKPHPLHDEPQLKRLLSRFGIADKGQDLMDYLQGRVVAYHDDLKNTNLAII